MDILTERLGMPTLRWPKHDGHLKHKDRIALVAFLACNGITQDEIMRLRAEMDIILTDKKAERAWAELAKKFSHDKKARLQYKAYSLKHRAYVPIANGTKEREFDFILDTEMRYIPNH